MIRTAFVVAILALGAGIAIAQQNPIAARKALMKANGDQATIGSEMIKGKRPFDLEKAHKIFATFEDAAAKAPELFPDNSKTGGDTTVNAAKLWANMDDFKARLVKLGADAKEADSNLKDLDSLKAGFALVGKDCSGCHELYRIKKS